MSAKNQNNRTSRINSLDNLSFINPKDRLNR